MKLKLRVTHEIELESDDFTYDKGVDPIEYWHKAIKKSPYIVTDDHDRKLIAWAVTPA